MFLPTSRRRQPLFLPLPPQAREHGKPPLWPAEFLLALIVVNENKFRELGKSYRTRTGM